VAPAQSKRRSRKRRRSTGARPAASPPRPPVRSVEVRTPASPRGPLATTLTGRTYGGPPPNPFGGLPLSELAIFFGAIAVVVGLVRLHEHHPVGPVLVVGVIVCVLGVTEVTAREHFSGYRSHTVLLSAVPAVVAETGLALLVGSIIAAMVAAQNAMRAAATPIAAPWAAGAGRACELGINNEEDLFAAIPEAAAIPA